MYNRHGTRNAISAQSRLAELDSHSAHSTINNDLQVVMQGPLGARVEDIELAIFEAQASTGVIQVSRKSPSENANPTGPPRHRKSAPGGRSTGVVATASFCPLQLVDHQSARAHNPPSEMEWVAAPTLPAYLLLQLPPSRHAMAVPTKQKPAWENKQW